MSGIPGAFSREGQPLGADLVGRMIAAASHRGPDGARCWTPSLGGPVVVGHQWLRVSPEDIPQPVVDASHGVVVSFDGRLDNRQELIATLASGAAAFRIPSDAELVLEAYLRWGERCPVRLLGDFAFAIWDGRNRSVFCARDVMGIKPFYYHLDARMFVWGSDLRQILASGVAPIEPNEPLIAEYLAKAVHSQSETLYRGVMRLPAAHAMTVTSDDVRIVRYWRIDPTTELNYRNDGEYAEQFTSLFREAVSCRVRSDDHPVGAYLSGGVDSSSVVGMTQALGRQIETFSLVFPGVPEADESAYIDDVVRKWALTSHKISLPEVEGAACVAHVERRGDALDLPADLASECLMSRMRERGMRVVLTGVGGDYMFGGSLYHYADLLKAGEFIKFAKQLRADMRVSDVGWSAWQPLWSGVRPLVPDSCRQAIRPLARRLGYVPGLPDWIDGAFASRVSLADRLQPPTSIHDASTFSRGAVCELFASGWPYLLLENGDRSASEYGLEERHPFFDRRIIEFGVAIPEAQRWTGDETKYVVRHAMREWLPESVYRRKDKGDFANCVAQAIEAIGGAALFDSLHIASLGWVKQDRVSAMYRAARRQFAAGDDRYCDTMFKLWMVGGIELWYRSVFLEGRRYGTTDQIRPIRISRERGPGRVEAPAGVSAPVTH